MAEIMWSKNTRGKIFFSFEGKENVIHTAVQRQEYCHAQWKRDLIVIQNISLMFCPHKVTQLWSHLAEKKQAANPRNIHGILHQNHRIQGAALILPPWETTLCFWPLIKKNKNKQHNSSTSALQQGLHSRIQAFLPAEKDGVWAFSFTVMWESGD